MNHIKKEMLQQKRNAYSVCLMEEIKKNGTSTKYYILQGKIEVLEELLKLVEI